MEKHSEKQLNFAINKNIEELIQQIEPLTKQNQANVNITSLLDEFHKTVIQSETYLRNGIFTINFGKAATFLDHAFYIYSKQIDLLWDMSIDSQRRHLSYDEESEEKVAAQKQLEEKAQKGRRGRKKKVVDEAAPPVDWNKMRLKIKKYCRRALANIAEFDFENELDVAETDPRTLEAFKEIRPIKNWHMMYPEKYLIRPYAGNNYTMEIDEECSCNNGNLATNSMNFLFPEIQRKFTYNYTNNKKIGTIGCDVSDQAFQHYIIEYGINPCDITTETYQNFKKYLDKYLTNGPEDPNLVEQRKKLCPRRPSIVVTRLPDDVVQNLLKQDDATPGTSRNDSGYFDDMDTTELPDCPEADNAILKESSASGELTLDKIAEAPKDSSTPKENSKNTDSENMVSETVERIERRRIKRRKENDEDDQAVPKKRISRKTLFKWLKTTTVALKRFEKFFYKHYLTEEGEGEIVMPDFSSDEEDNDEALESEPLQTVLRSTQISTDSGFAEASFLTETSELDSTNPQSQLEPGGDNGDLPESTNCEESTDTRPRRSDGLPLDFELTESDEMLRRYVQWNEHIREELKRYGQKDFDIHEYGTRILDRLSEEKPARFVEVLEGDAANDVARYFAAALQLVNTENIELTNWTEGEVASDLEIVLLSRDRHHEHLDSYQAPSKEMVKEKIKRLQATNSRSNVIEQNQRTYKRIKLSN